MHVHFIPSFVINRWKWTDIQKRRILQVITCRPLGNQSGCRRIAGLSFNYRFTVSVYLFLFTIETQYRVQKSSFEKKIKYGRQAQCTSTDGNPSPFLFQCKCLSLDNFRCLGFLRCLPWRKLVFWAEVIHFWNGITKFQSRSW